MCRYIGYAVHAAVCRLCRNMRAALRLTAKFNLKRAYVAPAWTRLDSQNSLTHAHTHAA